MLGSIYLRVVHALVRDCLLPAWLKFAVTPPLFWHFKALGPTYVLRMVDDRVPNLASITYLALPPLT